MLKNDRLINIRETAALLGCSPSTIWRRAADGSIPPPIRLGGMTRWSEAEMAEFLADARQHKGSTK